jgi:cation:H+ antiporter
MDLMILLISLLSVVLGANWFVSGASELASRFNISQLTIGLTVVAFGTSAPEMAVNFFSSAQGHSDLVMGNILGSNLFNLCGILGIVALITPQVVHSNTIWKEIPFSLLLTFFLFLLCTNFTFGQAGVLGRTDGVALLVVFAGFLYYIYRQLKDSKESEPIIASTMTLKKIILFTIGGFLLLIIGGKFFVDSAVELAQSLGMSEKAIGLTIVSIGTSLPELSTSIAAALKKNSEIAVGNVIGSNIFNISLILAGSSLIREIPYHVSYHMDFLIITAATLFLFLAMFTSGKRKLDRWEGFLLLLTYAGYLFFILFY